MVEQREWLIDFIFMYYCYIWPSKGFFSLRCFFFQNLAASCACRSRGHWKPHCVVISYSTEFARRSGSQNVWWRRIAHVRIVDGLCEPFFLKFFLFIFRSMGQSVTTTRRRRLSVGWIHKCMGRPRVWRGSGSIFTSQRLVFSWSLGAIFYFFYWSIYQTRNHCIFGTYYWWQ